MELAWQPCVVAPIAWSQFAIRWRKAVQHDLVTSGAHASYVSRDLALVAEHDADISVDGRRGAQDVCDDHTSSACGLDLVAITTLATQPKEGPTTRDLLRRSLIREVPGPLLGVC